MPRRPVCIVALLATLLIVVGCRSKTPSVPAANHATDTALEQALRTDAAAGRLASLHWPDFTDYKPLVRSFYEQRHWNPAWIDGREATGQTVALAELFALSGGKGLNPDDYDAALWPARLGKLATANDRQLAEFDASMTVAAMRYVSDLHNGRVNPSHFSFGVDVASKKYDLPRFLVQQVVAAGDMEAALKGVEPDSDEYRATLAALHRYQGLAEEARTPLPDPGASLQPDSGYTGAHSLAARLTLLGDLPEQTGDSAGYTQALAEGVRRFQRRHNLNNDGHLNPATVAALNVPLSTRVRQLEDTLERLRWLSPEYGDPPIAVNIPEYTLRAFDENHAEQFEMRVVVGKAEEEDHQTPVLVQKMRYLVFRPFWNLTPTIVKAEIVPKAEANRDYIASRNFEVVDRNGKPVANWTAAGLAKNIYMVREKPGATNSLGLVKFMLPNKLNIYLHSTPALQYFQRTRRDFSHGCIRLQEPEKLAAWVLRDQPGWTPEAIHDAMETGPDNRAIVLKKPIPVRIFYQTARVDGDGTVHFFNDIYGYDREMEDVLAKGDPFPVKPRPKQQAADTE